MKILVLTLVSSVIAQGSEAPIENEDKVGLASSSRPREAKQMWPFLTSYYIQDGQGPTHVGSGNLRALPTAVMPPPILSASGLFAKYTQQAPKIRKKSPNRGPWQFRSALITSSSLLEPASEPDKSKKLTFSSCVRHFRMNAQNLTAQL